MKKRDAYPSKYFKATDFPGKPMVLKIEMTRLEPFENNGKSVEKLVAYFVGQKVRPRRRPHRLGTDR
jgi:hypothetical protein